MITKIRFESFEQDWTETYGWITYRPHTTESKRPAFGSNKGLP